MRRIFRKLLYYIQELLSILLKRQRHTHITRTRPEKEGSIENLLKENLEKNARENIHFYVQQRKVD
jgi:hypothetical protein